MTYCIKTIEYKCNNDDNIYKSEGKQICYTRVATHLGNLI